MLLLIAVSAATPGAATVSDTGTDAGPGTIPAMKWLVVIAILVYVGFRVYVYFKPSAPVARAFHRRYLLRTDAHAMSRKELVLSALSFLAFAAAAIGLYFGMTWGASELGWRFFDARPVVVLGKAGLFIGAMALAASLFLLGAAVARRDDRSRSENR